MSSSSNWYSKLYTFKCHQERAKPTSTFLSRAPLLGQQWGSEYTFLLFYHGDLFGERWISQQRQTLLSNSEVQFGSGRCRRTGWTVDRWMDVEMAIRVRVLQILPHVIVGGPFLHSTSTKQIWSILFRAERGSQHLNRECPVHLVSFYILTRQWGGWLCIYMLFFFASFLIGVKYEPHHIMKIWNGNINVEDCKDDFRLELTHMGVPLVFKQIMKQYPFFKAHFLKTRIRKKLSEFIWDLYRCQKQRLNVPALFFWENFSFDLHMISVLMGWQ